MARYGTFATREVIEHGKLPPLKDGDKLSINRPDIVTILGCDPESWFGDSSSSRAGDRGTVD